MTGLANGTKYYFTVEAVNGVGSSGPSNELSATPSSLNLVLRMSNPGLFSGLDSYYLITVTNDAKTSTSGTLTITDTLPAGIAYQGTLISPGWSC